MELTLIAIVGGSAHLFGRKILRPSGRVSDSLLALCPYRIINYSHFLVPIVDPYPDRYPLAAKYRPQLYVHHLHLNRSGGLYPVDRPFIWYAWNALFAVAIWVLFVLDLRMIRDRIREPSGPTGRNLYALVEREQLLGIKFYMPSTVVFNVLAAVAVALWPEALIRRDGHVVIALGQLAAAFGYLLIGCDSSLVSGP